LASDSRLAGRSIFHAKVFTPLFPPCRRDIVTLLNYPNFIMKQNIKDRVKGSVKEAAGKVKETAGKATKNPRLEDEGRADKYRGKAQRKVGEVEKVVGA
jgi:uncharacterized protein YjbJ (UPF0337 family)